MKTQKSRLIEKQTDLRKRVCTLLKFTEEDMFYEMFDQAVEYMNNMTQAPDITQEFLEEPVFWSWWRQQWALIDESFLHTVNTSVPIPTLRRIYFRLHESIDTYPDHVIWDKIHESYSRMFEDVLRSKPGAQITSMKSA